MGDPGDFRVRPTERVTIQNQNQELIFFPITRSRSTWEGYREEGTTGTEGAVALPLVNRIVFALGGGSPRALLPQLGALEPRESNARTIPTVKPSRAPPAGNREPL